MRWSASVLVFSFPFLSACAENDSSMYVEGVLALEPPGCEATDDPGATHLLRGAMDIEFTETYEAPLLVANQLTPRGDKSQLRTETQGVELRGAEIRLTSNTGSLIDAYTVPAGGFVEPNRSEEPGYGTAFVTVLPPSVTREVARTLPDGLGASTVVIANLRVYGTTLGGVEVTSGEYSFPIKVCRGCLVYYPADAIVDGQCVAEDTPDVTQCVFGQDASMDCRSCLGSEICRSPGG